MRARPSLPLLSRLVCTSLTGCRRVVARSGVLAGGHEGGIDADRGVNAALDAGNNAGASAMARLEREVRKPSGSARNNAGAKQTSKL